MIEGEMTDYRCVVCGNKLIHDIYKEFDRPTDMMPIGPASTQCLVTKDYGYHCSKCMMVYKGPPK